MAAHLRGFATTERASRSSPALGGPTGHPSLPAGGHSAKASSTVLSAPCVLILPSLLGCSNQQRPSSSPPRPIQIADSVCIIPGRVLLSPARDRSAYSGAACQL